MGHYIGSNIPPGSNLMKAEKIVSVFNVSQFIVNKSTRLSVASSTTCFIFINCFAFRQLFVFSRLLRYFNSVELFLSELFFVQSRAFGYKHRLTEGK